jgi:hypothetical protein
MMKRTCRQTGDGGISESIGFLLIFTMVIVGIGLVTLYGYPMLLQQQTGADQQIMEKNMIVLQNDMKSLTYKTVPYKETSLNIGGGTLTVYNTSSTPPVSTITIFDSTDTFIGGYHSGDLRYESTSAGVDVSLQDGAVVMRNLIEPGSTMLAQPRWFYDSQTNTMVINLITLNSSTVMSGAGVGTVQMTMGMTNYTSYSLPPGQNICMTFAPDSSPGGQDYSTAWDTYFVTTMKMDHNVCGNTPNYRLPIDPNRAGTLVIKKYDVGIMSV